MMKLFLDQTHVAGSCFDVLQQYLRGKKKTLSEHTMARSYYNLYPLLLKAESFSNLSTEWLKKYIEKCWLRYAPDTIRTLVGDLKEFFKWCAIKGYLGENIAQGIKTVRQRKRRRRKAKAVPEQSIKKVMLYLSNRLNTVVYRDLFGNLECEEPKKWGYETIRALRDLFILTFLYETGARVGELSKLGSLAMDRAVEEPAPVYQITVIGKTDDRDYLFTYRTAELWRLWSKVRPAEFREYAVIGWGRGHYTNQMLPNGISHMLVRRCKEAGLEKPFRTHALRHAKIKRSRTLVGIEMASLLVDHSSIETTMRYDGVDEANLIDAAAKTGLKFNIWDGPTIGGS